MAEKNGPLGHNLTVDNIFARYIDWNYLFFTPSIKMGTKPQFEIKQEIDFFRIRSDSFSALEKVKLISVCQV